MAAGTRIGRHCRRRRACPGCSPPVTCAGARSNGSPPRWAKAPSPSRSCTATWTPSRCARPRRGNAMNRNTVRPTGLDRRQEMPGPGAAGEPRAAAGRRPLVPGMRRLLFVASVLVLLAGFQLFVFTGRTDTFFAWTVVNPLAAAFLGGSYWASVSIEALAGRQQLWANARIAVPAVFVFTVLTLVATLMHLGQFHLGARFETGTRIVTVAWIAIYVLVPLLMLIVLVVQARTPGSDPSRSASLPTWIYALLATQAIVLLGFGVALFAA